MGCNVKLLFWRQSHCHCSLPNFVLHISSHVYPSGGQVAAFGKGAILLFSKKHLCSGVKIAVTWQKGGGTFVLSSWFCIAAPTTTRWYMWAVHTTVNTLGPNFPLLPLKPDMLFSFLMDIVHISEVPLGSHSRKKKKKKKKKTGCGNQWTDS